MSYECYCMNRYGILRYTILHTTYTVTDINYWTSKFVWTSIKVFGPKTTEGSGFGVLVLVHTTEWNTDSARKRFSVSFFYCSFRSRRLSLDRRKDETLSISFVWLMAFKHKWKIQIEWEKRVQSWGRVWMAGINLKLHYCWGCPQT